MKLPETPKIDKKREDFLKKRRLGKYNPNYEPLIPYGYIYGLSFKRETK